MRKLFLIVLFCLLVSIMAGCKGSSPVSVSENNVNSGEGVVIGADRSFIIENMEEDDTVNEEMLMSMDIEADTYGVSSGNIINGGIACENDGWIYYYNKNDGKKLFRINEAGEKEPVGNIAGAIDINILNDRIIYQSGGIWQYDMLTGENIQLVNGSCRNIIVYGESIYYIKSENDVWAIHSIQQDGSNDTALTESISSYMNLYDGRIYYINGTDEGRIHSMNLDGSDDERVASFTGVEEIIVDEGVIYYVSRSSSGSELWKINIDGTGDGKIYGKGCSSINVSEGRIYFMDTDAEALCVINDSGSGYKILDEGKCSNINITSEWIYYFKTDEINYYRIRKDGTGVSAVD